MEQNVDYNSLRCLVLDYYREIPLAFKEHNDLWIFLGTYSYILYYEEYNIEYGITCNLFKYEWSFL